MTASWRALASTLIACVLAGCGFTDHVNPATTMTRFEASRDLQRMRTDPKPLERPVVILNGYHGPGSLLLPFVQQMSAITNRDRSWWHGVNYTYTTSIEAAARITINAVERRWPSDDPHETTELDVIAFSMGGLVAREAAIDPAARGRDGKRLNVRRLYTIGTPHRGARLARRIAPDRAARQMIPGSAYLAELDAYLPYADYDLLCFGQTNDQLVGIENMAPVGEPLVWAEGRVFLGHFKMAENPILIADLARRLRREQPIAQPGPLPEPTTQPTSPQEDHAGELMPAGGPT